MSAATDEVIYLTPALVPEVLDLVTDRPSNMRRGLRQLYVAVASTESSRLSKLEGHTHRHELAALLVWPVTGGANRAVIDETAAETARIAVTSALVHPTGMTRWFAVGDVVSRELTMEAQLRFAVPLMAAGQVITREIRWGVTELTGVGVSP